MKQDNYAEIKLEDLYDRELTGKQITFFMKKNNVTVRQLAEQLGISPTTLIRIRTGKQNISLTLILKLSQILEIPPNEFLIMNKH